MINPDKLIKEKYGIVLTLDMIMSLQADEHNVKITLMGGLMIEYTKKELDNFIYRQKKLERILGQDETTTEE